MFVYPLLNHYIYSHGKYTKCRTRVNFSWEPRKKGKHLIILIKCIQELSFMKVNSRDNPIMYICLIICTYHLLLQRASLSQNWKFMSTKTKPFNLILLLRALLQNWKFTAPKTRPFIFFCY